MRAAGRLEARYYYELNEILFRRSKSSEIIYNLDICNEITYNIDADRDMLYTCVTELTFKRHVMSSAAGTAERRFFYYQGELYEYISFH